MNAPFSLVTATAPGKSRARLNTWQSVRADVLARIRSGEWAPGTLIPTEQDMAVQMGCARATVNRALRDLADSGIIQRRRKVGTRVTARASRRTRLELPAIRDEIEALGAVHVYRMTDYGLVQPCEMVVKALQLTDRDPVVQVSSVYLADDMPHCWETIWLNPRALPAFTRAVFEIESPHEWLARSVPVTQARFSILAEAASAAFARHLQVAPGTPVLTIERTNSLDTMPASCARQFYAPRYRLDLAD